MRCGLYIDNKEMLLRTRYSLLWMIIVSSSDTESQGKLCNSPRFNPRILRYVVSEERQMKQCCTLALERCKLYLTVRLKSPVSHCASLS
jgi:hypothetical protein